MHKENSSKESTHGMQTHEHIHSFRRKWSLISHKHSLSHGI